MSRDRSDEPSSQGQETVAAQRLDMWLWCARFARSRPDCARMAQQGLVRINRQRAEKAHALVRRGDVLTLPAPDGRGVMVLRVVDLAQRRRSAPLARLLYDVVPETPAAVPPP